MAKQEHLDILKQGVEAWNKWREEHRNISPDLSGSDLSGANLGMIIIDGANSGRPINMVNDNELEPDKVFQSTSFNLTKVNLSKANLTGADLYFSNLSNADLSGANLKAANLLDAILSGTNLSRANLFQTKLLNTILTGAVFRDVHIGSTVIGNIDLSVVKNLETVIHEWPSFISIDTIYASHGNIPEVFLKGAGLDDTFIEYSHSLVGKPIQYYSCFISYSSRDEAFARRLYADLQNNNVRCWYAPEDLKIGDKFRHRIDESIRVYDKLLLVLSEASLASNWVGYEVEKALDKEPEGKHNVLFPIRLDKAILICETDWAKEIRKSRHIGDFEHWKDHDAYQMAFERLLRDLKAQS